MINKFQKNSTLAIYCLMISTMLSLTSLNTFAADEVMQLTPGESRVVNTAFDVNTIAVGDPEICDVTRTGPREVLVNAIKTGKTNILIWDESQVRREIDITVGNPKDAQSVADEVTEMIKNIEGVDVRVAGDRVMVEGSVFSRTDMNKINKIIDGLPNVVSTVSVSSTLRKVEAEEIEKAIGRKGVKVRPTDDGFLLQGSVSSKEEAEVIEAIASGFTENIVSALGIKKRVVRKAESNELAGALVQVDLNIIEIEKDALADLSSAFTASAGIDINAASDAKNTATGFLSIAEPNLRKLQDTGKARSLMQQSLVTQSSRKAVFFVGEEFPVTVTQAGGELANDYKKIGLTFDILPVALKGNAIDMVISVTSSTVTGEARGGAPILSTIKLDSGMHLFSGESIALAGAIKQRVSQSFFGSARLRNTNSSSTKNKENTGWNEYNSPKKDKPNRYLNQKNEVLVIVSPKILELPEDAIQRLGPEIQKSFKEYEYEDIAVDSSSLTADDFNIK